MGVHPYVKVKLHAGKQCSYIAHVTVYICDFAGFGCGMTGVYDTNNGQCETTIEQDSTI